ncbi:hypothetical protein [Pelagibacterium limicola]|uniref:hypothetical protein n=1 Tax=Pelagibacterium limicola TaxID=2791022 RepID=UPI0018B014FD|nr:hypothetical protein [Pelagibacterium limicola]
MNTFVKLFASAALLASSSTAVLAQADAGVGVSGDVDVEVGVGGEAGTNASGNAKASGHGETNYGSIISSLRTSGVTAADIEGLDATASIRIIALSDIRGNAAANASALDAALGSLETSIADIRAALGASAAISAALEAEGYTVDDVVAVTVEGGASVTIIVDDAA